MPHLWLLLWTLAAAPDPGAWSRAAAVAEAQGEYARAAALYARVVSEAAGSFYARKAEVRLEELRSHSDHGYAPYQRFQDVLQRYAVLGSDAAVAEVRAIVAAYPDSAVAPEALYWLGNEYREMRHDRLAALQVYRELADKYPENILALTALDRTGRLLEEQGRFAEARQVYDEMRRRHPGDDTLAAFLARRAFAVRGLWHKRAAKAARGVLAFGFVLFFVVGGYHVQWRRVWAAFWPKAGFALVLGMLPAAFLRFYDGIWSPSLTVVGVLFAAYALVLALLEVRVRAPGGRAVRIVERVVFAVLMPAAIWAIVLQGFHLWEAFLL